MKKLNLSFGKYSDANLLVKAQAIYAAMLANTEFPNPQPTMPVFKTAVDSFEAALSAALEGGRTNVATKNARRDELIRLLITLGNYVTLTADGDDVMLTSSGFPIAREREPLPPLENPQIISLEGGSNAGEIKVTIGAIKGARTYVYQYTKDPLNDANEWTGQNSTLTKFSFSNLESGKKYWCRVAAYGTNEQVVYSQPMARIAQ
jgi:hypothetical protein